MTASPSASARVYDRVKRDILHGHHPGGSFVTEGELAQEVGVSRTPVREALLRLETEGLVRLYPKKGALVVPVTAQAAHDVLEARLVIEVWAAQTLWPRRDEVLDELEASLAAMAHAHETGDLEAFAVHDRRFHEVLVAAAGNAVLSQTYHSLRDRQLTILATQMRMSTQRQEAAVADHQELLDLLRGDSLERFVAAVQSHVATAIARLGVGR